MKDILQKYWKWSLATLPVKKDKSPAVKTWKDCEKDLSAYDNAFGIGIICGTPSNYLECLDFDNHFADAKDTLSRFIEEIKPLYDKHKFPIQMSQNGGYHLLYRCSDVEGNKKLAQRPKWDEKRNRFVPDAIIETRGEGGYFCATPTPGYTLLRNSFEKMPLIFPDERKFIIEVAKSFNTWHEPKVEEVEKDGRPGDLFNQSLESKNEMVRALKDEGWQELNNGRWRRPGKKEGISATLGIVAENIFYCFTANGYPFEPNKAYTAFQVVTLLKYKGEFSEFAAELAERYKLDKPTRKAVSTQEERADKRDIDYDAILENAYIDLRIPIPKPPVIMRIHDFEAGYLNSRRLFTLGNFSAITGKGKSKKTYLSSIFLAAAINSSLMYRKIEGCLPEKKRVVLAFDTEQSIYDAFVVGKRVEKMLTTAKDVKGFFALREYEPLERCHIIAHALEKFKDSIGYVLIDGIADLAKANNDEEEATRVVGLLMKWSKMYNCHIQVIIHQNKADNFATGHLGSSIIKKAEAVLSVEKDQNNSRFSKVRCDMIRGTADFKEFDFMIQDDGVPVIEENLKMANYEIREFDAF